MSNDTAQTSTSKRVEVPTDFLKRVDLRRIYPEKYGCPIMVHCPVHGDEGKPNLGVYPKNVYCFHPDCNYSAGVIDYIKKVTGYRDMKQVLAYAMELLSDKPVETNIQVPLLSKIEPLESELAASYVHNLQGLKAQKKWLHEKYGLKKETIEMAQIGCTAKFPFAYTIPVYSLSGELQNIRFRVDPTRMEDVSTKYWGLKGRNFTNLYFPPALLKEEGTLEERLGVLFGKPCVLLTEGEMDSLALWQIGVPAISTTNGAGAFQKPNPELGVHLGHLEVLVCYDQDETGRKAGKKVVDALYAQGIAARQLKWDLSLGKDASELVAKGYTKRDFKKALITP